MKTDSELHADGTPHSGATNVDGATIRRLTYRKFVTEYPDLATSAELEYLVLACEEGGRWGSGQFRLVRDLVRLKVAPVHPLLRRSAALAYTRRWRNITLDRRPDGRRRLHFGSGLADSNLGH